MLDGQGGQGGLDGLTFNGFVVEDEVIVFAGVVVAVVQRVEVVNAV